MTMLLRKKRRKRKWRTGVGKTREIGSNKIIKKLKLTSILKILVYKMQLSKSKLATEGCKQGEESKR